MDQRGEGCMMAYKLLSRTLSSFSAGGQAKVEYKMNRFSKAPRWLRRRGYHITVFDTLRNAMSFDIRLFGDALIYKVECVKQKKLPPQLDIMLLSMSVWVMRDIHCNWPNGTLMFEMVKPLERII